MSTRSNICRENADGSYDVIYCHWDGYPSNNGRILFEHYQAPEKIAALLALGNLSSLGPETGVKHPFEKPSPSIGRPERANPAYKTFTEKYGLMCTAYGRDRGEEGTEAEFFDNYDALSAMLAEAWTEWVYVYRVRDGRWYYTNNPSPTWFKCCGEQRQTEMLTPKAWQEESVS